MRYDTAWAFPYIVTEVDYIIRGGCYHFPGPKYIHSRWTNQKRAEINWERAASAMMLTLHVQSYKFCCAWSLSRCRYVLSVCGDTFAGIGLV